MEPVTIAIALGVINLILIGACAYRISKKLNNDDEYACTKLESNLAYKFHSEERQRVQGIYDLLTKKGYVHTYAKGWVKSGKARL